MRCSCLSDVLWIYCLYRTFYKRWVLYHVEHLYNIYDMYKLFLKYCNHKTQRLDKLYILYKYSVVTRHSVRAWIPHCYLTRTPGDRTSRRDVQSTATLHNEFGRIYTMLVMCLVPGELKLHTTLKGKELQTSYVINETVLVERFETRIE